MLRPSFGLRTRRQRSTSSGRSWKPVSWEYLVSCLNLINDSRKLDLTRIDDVLYSACYR